MTEYCTVLPGDLTVAARKGYHRVVKVERRFRNPNLPCYDRNYCVHGTCPPDYVEMNSLVTYITVMDSNFNPIKSQREYVCDSAYCAKLEVGKLIEERDAKLKSLTEGYERLINLCTS